MKDAWSTKRYDMSYSEYLDRLIDHLIQIQYTIPQRGELALKDSELLSKQHLSVRVGQSSVVHTPPGYGQH